VMIYGAADFMGIPWETIIKQYRASLARRSFGRLDEYAKAFLRYIEANSSYFPAVRQETLCYALCKYWLTRLKARVRKKAESILKEQGSLPEHALKKIFVEVLREDVEHLKNRSKIPGFSQISPASLVRRYKTAIDRAITEETKQLLGAISLASIREGCALAILRDLYWHSESGLVVAGFGVNEFCPCMSCYTLDALLAGKLRVIENVHRRTQITSQGESATVVAFAQSEMVSLFMNGIDGEYAGFIGSFVEQSFNMGYPLMLEKVLEQYTTAEQRRSIKEKMESVGKDLSTKLRATMREYERVMHSDQIVEIVNHLPKEELAAMAEALVNLTSFKRHITKQAETVGGPVDVAVISRGDGFVWIKRKHYFTQALNPHFLANYFDDKASKS